MAARTARLGRSAYAAVNAGKSGCSAFIHTRCLLPRAAELSGVTIALNGITSVAYSLTGITDGVTDNVVKSVKSLHGVERGLLRQFHSSTPLYSASTSSSQELTCNHEIVDINIPSQKRSNAQNWCGWMYF
ncbi:uncharacterized protein LOC122073200 [Macadamia integrifolia]|uniref:uncharacterized protein LOC122073200 n=1 Tax=Macadamia integrifolia TaxID=60698 RepID=UPI001C4FF951|nr:uncharacterized protein LOC122073200 [Macadamia integrifolia]